MLGIHLNRKHEDALDEIFETELNIPVFQIFLHNSRTGELLELPDELVSQPNAKIYVHGPYIDRLTAGRYQNEGIAKRLKEAATIGAVGYVIHLYAEPVAQVHTALSRIFHKLDYKALGIRIYLEAHVVSDRKFEELKGIHGTNGRYIDPKVMGRLFAEIHREPWADWVRVCLDTAHAWACGWDITRRSVLTAYLRDLGQRQIMVHLNDSKQDFGDSSRDVHDVLGRKMWTPESMGMALRIFMHHHWDCIIEASSGVVESLNFARDALHTQIKHHSLQSRVKSHATSRS